jgi:hypothetical protein
MRAPIPVDSFAIAFVRRCNTTSSVATNRARSRSSSELGVEWRRIEIMSAAGGGEAEDEDEDDDDDDEDEDDDEADDEVEEDDEADDDEDEEADEEE